MTQPVDMAPLKNVLPGTAASEADIARAKLDLIECAGKAMRALEALETRQGPWLYHARDDAERAQKAMGRAVATLGKNDS